MVSLLLEKDSPMSTPDAIARLQALIAERPILAEPLKGLSDPAIGAASRSKPPTFGPISRRPSPRRGHRATYPTPNSTAWPVAV